MWIITADAGLDVFFNVSPYPIRSAYTVDLRRHAPLRMGLMGPFAAVALMAAQPGYVDSAVCAGCHADVAKNYSRTGMGRSLRAVSKTVAEPEFNGSSFFHAASRELFTFTLRNGIPWIR